MNSINGFDIEKYNQHGFKDGAKTDTCFACSPDRKKKTDKCCSLNWEKGFFSCHHCGESGQLHTYKKSEPIKPRNRRQQDQVEKYFFFGTQME